MKECTKCKEVKSLDCFHNDTKKPTRTQTYCKLCRIADIKKLDYHFRRCFKVSVHRAKTEPSYIKREHTLTWEEWLTFKPKYAELHKKWEESNYDKSLTPSIDRIDNCKGYVFDNIQVIPLVQNMKKDGSRGEDNARAILKDYDVTAIRALKKANPKLRQSKLGKMFNITQTGISKILLRQTWKHLPEPKLLI